MVSTRRTESSGSAVDTVFRHSRKKPAEGGDNSDSCSSSDSEPSQEEESWSSQCPTAKQIRHRRTISPTFIGGRVRELRNRFVCSNIAYSSNRVRSKVVRNCPLDERRRKFTHAMPNDSDDFIRNQNDSDEIFLPRRQHSLRHSRHSSTRRPNRLLRPLKNQSYADPHSSMTHSNSSGDEKPEIDLRRSTRQRTLKYDSFNTSWITDAQMVRGYPNLKMDFLSDQDSRHSQVNGHHEKHGDGRNNTVVRKANHSEIEVSRDKSSRHSEPTARRDLKKNMKFIYGYETTEVRTRRVSVRGQSDVQDGEERNGIEPKKAIVNDNLTRSKVRLRRGRSKEKVDTSEETNGDDTLVNGKEEEEVTKTEEPEDPINDTNELDETEDVAQKADGDADSESEHEIRRQRKRSRRTTLNYMDDPRFSPRKTRSRKITDSEKSSDSSDEDIRNQRYKYQLRKRTPKKPTPISLEVPLRRSDRLVHGLCARRRRDRRRDSSSDESSEVDPARSRKINKTKHSRHPGTNNSSGDGQLKSGPIGNAPAPIGPETLDKKVRFASVGGLDNHVRCLREMVILPMMYPEVFRQFQIQPPRGVLFHGPPGTGKTLLARALANECSFGSRKVTFFMRKGADLLSKWVGESEKQLRMLFEQAAQMKPSIIFFDELDGLAPVRSSRQDQIHASIVSTLLALMDGLDSRGEVIVIGATNRIDAIDPALRRPGRFDRELFFPLPARKEREEIIRVHVAQWALPPNEVLIAHLAEHSAGYCGSDLRALCSEAVIQGLRRTYPQVYTTDHRLQLDPTRVKVEKIDFLRARSLLIPASHRVSQGHGRKLPSVLEPIYKGPLETVLGFFKESFPHGLDPALATIKVSNGMQTAKVLLTGSTHEQGQSIYLAPAVLYHMEHVNTYTLDLTTLYKESARCAEEACVEVFQEARRNVPSVIYVPAIEQWWNLVGETVRAIFISQLSQLDPGIPILLLATANVEYKDLPDHISSIFSTYRKEVLHLSAPVPSQREAFFKPLIITASLRPPKSPKVRPKTPPPLPRAPTPPPDSLTESELKVIYDKEEETLRELRIFLRDMCKKLASNKMFYMFTKPVDMDEVPDYLNIIKQPMDLETMMTKVDLHRYSSAQEFLADVDLICVNALEYNPAKTTADKQIRHRACSLRDYAHALIKAEMDSDFEEHCRNITERRKERKASVTQFLPPFIHTFPNQDGSDNQTKDSTETNPDYKRVNGLDSSVKSMETPTNCHISPNRKRKVPLWAQGYLNKKRKRSSGRHILTESQQRDEAYKMETAVKCSSGDESKENKPEDSSEAMVTTSAPDSPAVHVEPASITRSSDLHIPLTVNCDTDIMGRHVKASPLGSNASKRSKFSETLSPAIWPSFADLIDDTPEIDEPELHEANENQHANQRSVTVDIVELENVLSQAVTITKGSSILAVMDLYGQLSRVVTKYSRTHERKSLPQDLQREVLRFQDLHKNHVTASRCSTPAS